MQRTRNPLQSTGFIAVVVVFCLGFLCSCATQNPSRQQLPADVTMNPEAGRGAFLVVTVRLADGRKLPVVVDTGCPITSFDKSLEPELDGRIDTTEFWNFGVQQEVGIYAAPKLYLGKVPLLMNGTNVITYDHQQLADHGGGLPFMGILGMDVLTHYCLQLNFTAGKMCFLDSDHADKTDWGRAFPLTDIGDGCFSISENLAGTKGLGSVIDTGCDSSGWLRPEIYQQWTNRTAASAGEINTPNGMLGGEVYRDLDLRPLDAKLLSTNDTHTALNGIGLHTLSENLVTLDFPHQVMYLQRTSKWPLLDKHETATALAIGESALKSLIQWKKSNQLSGASKNDKGRTTDFHFDHREAPYLDSVTWDLLKEGDFSIYHYTVTRTSKNDSWKLQKAWRTDDAGKTLEEFPVP